MDSIKVLHRDTDRSQEPGKKGNVNNSALGCDVHFDNKPLIEAIALFLTISSLILLK